MAHGPPAGIGKATLRATLKLWLGFPPKWSGVFSAGNGPAMRCPLLGAAIDDLDTLARFVHASTRITHTDPKAYDGALAVAVAAWCARRGFHDPAEFLQHFRLARGADADGTAYLRACTELDDLLARVQRSVALRESTEAFAEALGCGQRVSGYVYHTVPVVLHSWLSQPRDYRRAVASMIRCGGDADTTAAIVGAIVGSGVGPGAIPQEWIDGLWEWPRSVAWMRRLAAATADAVTTGTPTRPPSVFPAIGLARNAIFLGTVLGHAARRMLPPY